MDINHPLDVPQFARVRRRSGTYAARILAAEELMALARERLRNYGVTLRDKLAVLDMYHLVTSMQIFMITRGLPPPTNGLTQEGNNDAGGVDVNSVGRRSPYHMIRSCCRKQVAFSR
ncbi:hypothetical protein M514_02351 [Trichuris suis]|uniref:Uncharacterized protein n=1 Tax=Trichuris suis TaxID=68888 RepID=A0A085NBM3_9BILA|nr:hypothetical protein M513_02351 [Trichuris suis]KFD66869.1 hypothetical protein M514_02351 [Trichuris suis]